MIRFFAIAAIVVALTQPLQAQTDIGGRYQVRGTNINGSTYDGEAEITLTSETTCEIKWVTPPTESVGICMRNGDSFSAAYRLGDVIGLVIYKVLPDGSMQGLWTIAGNGGAGTEILTPM